MKRYQKRALAFLFLLPISVFAQDTSASNSWRKELYSASYLNGDTSFKFVNTPTITEQSWNELAQPQFWKKIMTLSPDSCVINIGSTRRIVAYFSLAAWDEKSNDEKSAYRDSVRLAHHLPEDEHIYRTIGKSEFYLFDKVIPTIPNAVEIFCEQGVDPWYAQSILLIESPGRLHKSSVGAYGAFQLMPKVARMLGLTVNRSKDERKDFNKSAVAASKMIKTICIPQAERILSEASLTYDTTDLWFRLFVLHIYHAGAYNVEKVIKAIAPNTGGKKLITQMWQTRAGSFGNASQNYSQIALATLMVLSEKVTEIKL